MTSHRLFRVIQISTQYILSTNQENAHLPSLNSTESGNMGLVPYNLGPQYSVEEINHRQHLNNSANVPLFCTTSIIFQNFNEQYCFGFLIFFQQYASTNLWVEDFACLSVMLESV